MKNNVSVYVDKETMRPYYRVEISLPVEELQDAKVMGHDLSEAIGNIVLLEVEQSKRSPPATLLEKQVDI